MNKKNVGIFAIGIIAGALIVFLLLFEEKKDFTNPILGQIDWEDAEVLIDNFHNPSHNTVRQTRLSNKEPRLYCWNNNQQVPISSWWVDRLEIETLIKDSTGKDYRSTNSNDFSGFRIYPCLKFDTNGREEHSIAIVCTKANSNNHNNVKPSNKKIIEYVDPCPDQCNADNNASLKAGD